MQQEKALNNDLQSQVKTLKNVINDIVNSTEISRQKQILENNTIILQDSIQMLEQKNIREKENLTRENLEHLETIKKL